MEINKEFFKKNIIAICSVLSILLLFLPFGKITMEVESSFMDISASSSVEFTGFDVIFGSNSVMIAWLMFIFPILLIVMNYIPQLDKYKSILAMVLPIVSILACVVAVLTAGAGANVAAGSMDGTFGASVEGKNSPQIGFFLLIISYIGTLVGGAVTFYGLNLSKEGISEFSSKINETGIPSVESLRGLGGKIGEGVSAVTSTIKSSIPHTGETTAVGGVSSEAPVAKPTKGINVAKTGEVLDLIKQLSEMKEQGILSEEEFSEKKKELLTHI